MTLPEITDNEVLEAHLQFVFPFSLEDKCQDRVYEILLGDGFIPFELGDLSQEDAFYGPKVRVSHRRMERYYLPFSGLVLFPANPTPAVFRRLSKPLGLKAMLVGELERAAFTVHSADVLLCPFNTGFVTLRVELSDEPRPLTHALEFADRFRALQDANRSDSNARIEYGSSVYEETEEFLFREIVPQLLPYLDTQPMDGTYFEKLPFLMDERMFVIAIYRFAEDADISLFDRYRSARLDGMNDDGSPAISATHLPYIESYLERYGYDRWGPNTYYVTDEICFCCLTREPPETAAKQAGMMHGEYYYGLLLNLFHRIVLLKLSSAYSRVRLERDPDKTEELIREITAFSAKYYFLEVVSQTSGREIFIQLRNVYGNDELFDDVKMTLTDLFKYQENHTSKRSNYLLTVLTIYTVISGIYGMNLVIEDLKGRIDWTAMSHYSLFQWIALVVTGSGIVVGVALALRVLWQWGRDFVRVKLRR